MPRPLHRIWFGEPFPEKYTEYLVNLRKFSPDSPIMLWTDSETQSEKSFNQLKEKCKSLNISVCNIRDYPQLLNFDLIIKTLDASKNTMTHKKLYYVRASDLARIGILFLLGGIYIETDTQMLAPIPDYKLKHGILIKQFYDENYISTVFSNEQDDKFHPYFIEDLHYDFIAADAGNPYLKLCADITRLDFETHNKSIYKNWEKSDVQQILMYGTIKLTGTALKWALNYAYQHDQFNFKSPDEFVVDLTNILKSDYDKSWLSDFETTKESLKKEYRIYKHSLKPWINELTQARLKAFPIVLPKEEMPVDMPRDYFDDDYHFDFGQMPHFDINEIDILNRLPPQKEDDTVEKMLANFNQRSVMFFPAMQQDLPTFKLPEFSKIETSSFVKNIKLNFLTPEMICEKYANNGGSWLKRFSIFGFNNNTDEIIKTLEERAKNNPGGASSLTLKEIKK